MFSKLKLKLRSAPQALSSVSQAIKSSLENLLPLLVLLKTLSASIAFYLGLPKNLVLAVAYDPVQLLFAVATRSNEIHVFGQFVVEVVFEFRGLAPITELRFVKGVYLVAMAPTTLTVTVLSLHLKQILGTFSVPGAASSFELDYSLDFLVCGLANGQIMFYDIDRLNMTPFRVDNLQKRFMPKERLLAAFHIEWHPRDIGLILVTYSHSAVVYLVVKGDITASFVYVAQRGTKGYDFSQLVCSGGKKKMFGSAKDVVVEVKEAHWHPNGLHVVTVHVDNTLCFWDAADGTLLQARSLFEVNLHQPGEPRVPAKEMAYAPITAARWVCLADPELTQLVIAGGDPEKPNVLLVLDFGAALLYLMTSHEKQGQYYALPPGGQRQIAFAMYEIPKQLNTGDPEVIQRILPVTPTDFCYFNGGHDPHYLFLLLNYGLVYLVPYSTTGVVSPLDLLLPPSLLMVVPPVTFSKVRQASRTEWFSLLLLRKSTGALARLAMLLRGGMPAHENLTPRPIGADSDARLILITGHEHGVVRMLDISRGGQQTPELMVTINLGDSLFSYGHPKYLKVLHVSVAFELREMVVALALGEVVVCRFGKAHNPTPPQGVCQVDYSQCPVQHANEDAKLINIELRTAGNGVATFIPLFLLQLALGENITCVKMCNAGFAAVAYLTGRLVVCDITRGPAVIFNTKLLSEFLVSTEKCHATCLEFLIMECGHDGYSLLMLLVGTNGGGHFLLFKVVPMGNGGWLVQFENKLANLNYRRLGGDDPATSKLDKLIAVNAADGLSARASLPMFQRLSQGVVIPGYIVATSHRDIRVLQLPKSKLSHKVIDEHCVCLGIVRIQSGIALAVLTKLGFFKLLSLPALSDLADVKLPKDIYERVKAALERGEGLLSVLPLGLAFIRTLGLEAVAVSIYHTDSKMNKQAVKEHQTDVLFNDTAIIPPRPTAAAITWAKGQATYVSSEELAQLLCGPNRKMPKFPELELAYNISPEANPNQVYGQQQTAFAKGSSDPYGQPSGRREKDYKEPIRKAGTASSGGLTFGSGFMNLLQNTYNAAEEQFHNYANQASEAMNEGLSETKSSFYSSALKSKVGM